MKLIALTNDDVVVDTIEDIDKYDLDKTIAQSVFLDEVREIVKRGREMEEEGL